MRVGGRPALEGSEVQAQAGDPSVLSDSICGGGLEFTGVLFPFQLRLSLNRKGSCKPPPPHSTGEKTSSRFLKTTSGASYSALC